MSWAQLAAEKELRYGPTLPAPNSLSHLLKGISQGCIFYPDDFPTNLKASPGWGLRSNATFLEARVHLPPLLSLPSTPVSLSFCVISSCAMNSDPDTSTSLTASMKLPCKPFFRVCCELSGSHQQVSSATGGTIHPTSMVPPAKPREIARYAVSINTMLSFRGRQVRGKLNG